MRLTGLMALNIPAWKINRIEVSIFLLSVNEFYDRLILKYLMSITERWEMFSRFMNYFKVKK